MKKITDEILGKMRVMRKEGATYEEIQNALSVSKWACMTYLKGIEIEQSAVEKAWRKAEKDALVYLGTRDFEDLHDLNGMCPTPYWDILARKGTEWWLIDVTVSEGKKIGRKIPYFVDNYIHAILYRHVNDEEWKLVKLSYEEVK